MKLEVGGKNKTCSGFPMPGKCCRHTLEEAAEWDFNVRGKCWVLRSLNQKNSIMKGNRDIFGGNHPNNVVSIFQHKLKYLNITNEVLKNVSNTCYSY